MGASKTFTYITTKQFCSLLPGKQIEVPSFFILFFLPKKLEVPTYLGQFGL